MTPIQLEKAWQVATLVGCGSFFMLLMASLLFRGMPSIESLLIMLGGSSVLGFFGFYLGGVIASPIMIEQSRKQHPSKQKIPLHAQSPEESSVDSVDLNESDIQQQQVSSQFEQMQDFIPPNYDSTSEHEWVDDNQSPVISDTTTNKTKAFEA
jgi:hypothetical protein